MYTVLSCLRDDHNIWLVGLAAIVCTLGAWTSIRIFSRASDTKGMQRFSWQFLTGIAAGSSVWCTHFIAMLAYDPGVPITLAPERTVASLFISVVGIHIGYAITQLPRLRSAPALGGSIVGIAIAAMHYVGMSAYQVDGLVLWDTQLQVWSIIVVVFLSAASTYFALRKKGEWDTHYAVLCLVLAIVSLHFTGMAAMDIIPMRGMSEEFDPSIMRPMAMAVAGVGLLIVGCGLSSYAIENDVQSQSLAKLKHLASHDVLTGLPNRQLFEGTLRHMVETAPRRGKKLAVIGIDLNRFKEINDVRGHAAGDFVLKTLARRMTDKLQDGQLVARLGGDEFYALSLFSSPDELDDLLNMLEAALFQPMDYEGNDIFPGASLGISIAPDHANTADQLVMNADLAMYRAKNSLTNHRCLYEAGMDEEVRERRALVQDLRRALERGQLELHYQAQSDLQSEATTSFEALLRWPHPERGYISPAEFIPLAEESGLILDIGEWVLRKACSDAATWPEGLQVAVNLSPVQFAHSDLPAMVLSVLTETGLSPKRLELELTESTIFLDKTKALQTLRMIKSYGVSIALDDFGTGYSSLETLRAFPYDKIKLDRSFMNGLLTSDQSKAILRAVLTLGDSLAIPVLAEGIETADQLDFLRQEGCNSGQGFYLARPAHMPSVEAFLATNAMEPVNTGESADPLPINAPDQSTYGT